MTTTYKFKAGYTKLGVAIVPATAPTINIRNVDTDTLLVTGAAVISSAVEAGGCNYSYAGADGLDLVGLFHTTDTTVDQQDLRSYTPDILTIIDLLVDAIKLKTDLMDASAITVVAAVNGSTITILRGDTFTASLTNIGALTDYVSIDFTVKYNNNNPDTDAIIRIRKNASGVGDGLLRLNGAAPTTETGSITIDDLPTGDITIALDETTTDDLFAGVCIYDVQLITATAVKTLTSGQLIITADVTRLVV